MKPLSLDLEKFSFLLVCALLVAMGLLDPLHQPSSFHQFADASPLFGIPHGLNVMSNLAFLAPGFWLLKVCQKTPDPLRGSLNLAGIGLVLTGIGSGLYHLNPIDSTLVWDRLPMVITFAGVMGAMAYQHLSTAAVYRWQNAWLYLGLVSVVLWAASGDLRLYLVVQFGGFLVGLLWMVCSMISKEEVQRSVHLPWGWVWFGYALAKLTEHLDHEIWQASAQTLSGHPLKHVFAGLGLAILCDCVQRSDHSLLSRVSSAG